MPSLRDAPRSGSSMVDKHDASRSEAIRRPCRDRAEGEEMTAVLPNMIQRQILQRLALKEWKLISRLGVMAGEGLLAGMVGRDWIERRGLGSDHAIKITQVGAEALAAKIPINPPTRRMRTVPRSGA